MRNIFSTIIKNKNNKENSPSEMGFTLIEVMVSLALFTIVVMISLSSLTAMVNANQKAQALKSVLNNLNFALENMERSIRVGRRYHCELDPDPSIPYSPAVLGVPQDCINGKLIAFESSKGSSADINDQVAYRLMGEQIEISKDSAATWLPLTSGRVTVESLSFTVEGSNFTDGSQPLVIITLKVSTGPSAKTFTTLSIQTSASQRVPDF